jgi:aspartate carbamoyltransferase catalytic subunit
MSFSFAILPTGHLLCIEGLQPPHINALLDLAESYALLNRQGKTQRDLLKGRTLINLFFEDSTRTRTSFELAGKRLGADIVNMSVSTSSVNKGETLLDTAATLNAMHTDLLVVRHGQSGRPALLAQKVDAAVINAGDGTHEHPTQALLMRSPSAATRVGWRGWRSPSAGTCCIRASRAPTSTCSRPWGRGCAWSARPR